MKCLCVLFCVLIISLVGFSSCSSKPTLLKELSLDASSSGKEVTIAVSGTLTITLESNMTTGFKWELTGITDTKVLDNTGNQYIAPGASSGGTPLVGASGKEIWTFKALQKGKSSINMQYSQPWQGGTKGAKTFSVAVTVD